VNTAQVDMRVMRQARGLCMFRHAVSRSVFGTVAERVYARAGAVRRYSVWQPSPYS